MNTTTPDLVHWPSKTKNGGRTTIIPSTADAVKLGCNFVETIRDRVQELKRAGHQTVQVKTHYRDSNKTKTKTISINAHELEWEETIGNYESAVSEITLGNPGIKHHISELATKLMQMAKMCQSLTSAGTYTVRHEKKKWIPNGAAQVSIASRSRMKRRYWR